MTDLQEKLQKLYEDVNNLLRFGEAKNVGLIAFNIAVIVGITKLLIDFKDINWLLIIFSYVIIMCLISILIAFMSTVPQIKHKASELLIYNSDNLLFFGKIASMKPSDFLHEFTKKYNFISENEIYEKDLCRQIVIVSQIALRKMKFFKIACFFTLAGIATPISLIAYKLFSDHNK